MLRLSHIKKSFAGVKALKDVTLEVKSGEIHALLGENGAGKSTLMKVISGAHLADEGSIMFNECSIIKNTPANAKALGISIIYQEFSLVPSLTVSENIYLGKNQVSNWLNWNKINHAADQLIQSLGFEIDVTKEVSNLSVAEQQVVEIAKALTGDVKLLILDEPSAVLGTTEVHKLFDLLRKLRDNGVAIIYISHHLDELLELTDRITVLKDGTTIDTVRTADMSKDKLISLMVGRELTQMYPIKEKITFSNEELNVTNVTTRLSRKGLSFKLQKGEILGIGGLVGAGRTEVLHALFGELGAQAASIILEGNRLKAKNPKVMVKNGWGMVPEDRKKMGGILHLSIKENVSLANLKKISNKWGFINLDYEQKLVNDLVEKLKTKINSINDPLSTLSGGNQQKVILAKWLNVDLKGLLIDEPTRGVDVGARLEIYTIIQNLANQGVYIIMVSSDMEELMGLSDRIIIMCQGAVAGEIEKAHFSEETILKMAIGTN